MAVPVYALDLYPRDDPRDGTLIRTLTPQKAGWRDEANSTGSGFVEVRSTSDDGQAFDPRGLDYVRVRDTANADRIVGGFFNDKAKIKLLSKDSNKLLRVEGAGTLSYLARSVMAPHTYLDIAIGQDPISGVWFLSNQGPAVGGNLLGSILWRVVYEAQHYRVALTQHRHADGVIYTDSHDDDRLSTDVGIPDLVLGFDQFEDSDGNPWTLPSGEFKAQVNDNLLTVVKRLMESGLYVELDPDTFELRAWEGNEHRRDLTGSAWASDVVRLQAPTDGTTATGNMLSDADREVAAHVKRRTLYVGSQGVYARVAGSTDIPWEGGVDSDVEDTEALEQIGTVQLQARSDAGDTLKVRLKSGDDPTEGTYIAWDHVRPDDLITVHTGDDQWEYDEQDFPVAAVSIKLREGGDWETWLELGASFAVTDRTFRIPPQPNANSVQLCQPANIGGDLLAGISGLGDGVTVLSHSGGGGTGWPSSVTDGTPEVALVTVPSLPGPETGNWWRVDFSVPRTISAFSITSDPWDNNGPKDIAVQSSDDGSSWVTRWQWSVDGGPDVRTDGSGWAIAPGQTYWAWDTVALPGGPIAARYWRFLSASHIGGGNPWFVGGLSLWGQGIGDDGPMPVGGNSEADHGTSNRATRCDHVHPHSDLSDHSDEIHHHADSIIGLEPGVTDHGDLTGLGDDDHPQYQTEAEVDAQIAAAVATLAAGDLATRWTPVTTWNGDHWIIVTDGDGTPVLTEVA